MSLSLLRITMRFFNQSYDKKVQNIKSYMLNLQIKIPIKRINKEFEF